MASFKATITDPIGLHARPASVLSKAASGFASDIKIKSGGKEGNVKSIMNIMALAIKQGAEIEIIAEGADADDAIAALESVMKKDKLI
jgi:phosphocarrier protein HPr